MFSYNGEPHGLRNRDNMKHWTVHMDEFFDHYLLGKPRPEWMDKGVTLPRPGQARRLADVQEENGGRRRGAPVTGRYSARRADTGSTRVARHAGTAAAISATAPRRAATTTNVAGSHGRTP